MHEASGHAGVGNFCSGTMQKYAACVVFVSRPIQIKKKFVFADSPGPTRWGAASPPPLSVTWRARCGMCSTGSLLSRVR